ncbi:MBL fold metallo-hydrolase [Aurantiacibacter odishensis]|uniref:MBL fold metallo-hydrolase n=1 Tax=Aurantiacibacter odishensis TaxID=1155476 RepID=UPI000E762B90|nr:MBL fold metallo-hydrolase [Aurantiacibacter odishensis]
MMKMKSTSLLAVAMSAILATGACASVAQEAPANGNVDDNTIARLAGGTLPAANSLTLLGTGGGPISRPDRAGSATLLRLDGHNYLIDAGQGVVEQLSKVGISSEQVPLVFLTHMHDDHYVGLPALASFSFTLGGSGVTLIGPERTGELEDAVEAMMDLSAEIRIVENRITATVEDHVKSQEIAPGEIYRDDRVIVTALENHHYRFAAETDVGRSNSSLAFAFEMADQRIVFTGDTGPFDELADFARGADILVAEMASYADRNSVPDFVIPHMDREHLSPTEAGRLAAAAGVETLILSHIGVVGEDDIAEIKRHFSGRVIAGEDLMTFPLD